MKELIEAQLGVTVLEVRPIGKGLVGVFVKYGWGKKYLCLEVK